MKKISILSLILISITTLSGCNKTRERNPSPTQPKENAKGYVVEAKDTPNADWFVKDPQLDQMEGVSSERSQAELALKNQRQILVAVIDSGVDIKHEDLKSKIWTNPGETGLDQAGQDKSKNGLDDDNNGYIDDIHGWNYLGSKDGQHIDDATLEVTREALRYDRKIASGEALTETEKIYFEGVVKDFDQQVKAANEWIETLKPDLEKADAAKKILKEKLELEDYSLEKLEAIQSTDSEIVKAKTDLIDICTKYRSVERLYRLEQSALNTLKFNLNKEFNDRAIVGDDPNDFSDIHYGNNDVKGPDASHGTHVAGIIGAQRNNGLGIDGIAENVKIMALRAVPNGDEYDKDIALAIRYAVDNGAKVINMSFGKRYSPHKSQVDDAFLYAADKGVLIFHAAGNESSNNDEKPFYPNRHILDSVVKNKPSQVSTWIEVGASAQTKNFDMVANFSNYGKKDVDLFSPGYKLRSTVPDNKYDVYSGTSMASPAAAGVGALLMSNFETMTGKQAKAILLRQVRLYDGLEVHLPGSDVLDLPVPFASLSATGGVIDAYRSIQLARDLSN